MSELFALEQCTKARLLNAEEEGPRSALSREAYLIGGGIKDGFVDRLNQARNAPALTTLEFGTAIAVGAGITAMSMAGGRWSTAAKIGTRTLEFAAIGDGARRLIPSAFAIGDTLVNPENYLQNRAVIARNLGSACFDYPLMLAGGIVGSSSVRLGTKAAPTMLEKFASHPSQPRMQLELRATAHENPPGTWQQSVPEGSNVNWLNSIPETPTPVPKPLSVKGHENPPGAWQESVPQGSNVNWLNSIPETPSTAPKPPGVKGHENPLGTWQQSVPEGSNVNWLNSIPETQTTAPKPPSVKGHENPPGAWQQPLPEGSNVNWL